MTRKTLSLASILSLILISISANSHIEAMGINPKESIKKQGKTVFGTGKVYTISESIKSYHTSAIIIPEKNEPIEMVYQFFEQNRRDFPMENVREELRFMDSTESRLTFKQVYHGILTEAETNVWFDNDVEIDRFDLTYYEISGLLTSPRIDSATAEDLARKDLSYLKRVKIAGPQSREKENLTSKKLEDLGFAYDYSTRLTISRFDQDTFRLIWVVLAQQESPPYDWTFYIDAQEGKILYKRDEIRSSASLGTYKIQKILADFEHYTKCKAPPKGDPVEMAYQFFELNKDRFQMKNPRKELIVPGKVIEKKTEVITFLQTHNGIPIEYGGTRVYFNPDGEIRKVEGEYYYGINLPSIPTIDSATAVKIALQAMGSPHPKVSSADKLMIVSSKTLRPGRADRFYLIRIVEIFPDSATSHGWY